MATSAMARGLYLEEIGVPLVILAPGARQAEWWRVLSACATCLQPWSTCWGFRRARRSQAARWRPTGKALPGKCRRESPPQPSRSRSSATEFQPKPGSDRGPVRFRMSLVASGHHYFRDGMGTEALYDLRSDPFERVNLVGSSDGNQSVGAFRKMLVEVLTDNPGSIEVDKAYLEAYKQGLKALIPESSPRRVAPAIESRSILFGQRLKRPHDRFSGEKPRSTLP